MRQITFKKLDDILMFFDMANQPAVLFWESFPIRVAGTVTVTGGLGETLFLTCTVIEDAFAQWKRDHSAEISANTLILFQGTYAPILSKDSQP